MEDFAFVVQLCEDQALCIKVQLLSKGLVTGLIRHRMKCNQAFLRILSRTILTLQGGITKDFRALESPPLI